MVLPMPTRRELLDLIYRDDDLVAVMKPARLATIPGRDEDDSVLERLGRQLKLPSTGTADPRVRVVHRLDKETSGVLLFALNVAAQRFVSDQFQNNTTEKQYLALVAGRPEQDDGEVDAPLAVSPTSKVRMAVARHGGRPARTVWHVESRYRDYALLRVFPKTGKTHQIRVHLLHAGLPLAVDPLYHPVAPGQVPGIFLSRFKRGYSPTRGEQERPLIDRLTLHAERLKVTHPNGTELDLIAPPPKDFRAVVNMLGRHSAR